MPPGEMTWKLRPTGLRCEGFEDDGTWEIIYNMCGLKGGYRVAFLPDTKEGRIKLALLVVAFERKLTFTIGRSLTTGHPNSVIWAGIHHKTSTKPGPYGYPDQSYFLRVREELLERGVEYTEGIVERVITNSVGSRIVID